MHPNSQKWVGLCTNQEDEFLEWVVSASYFKEVSFGPIQFSVAFMGILPKSIVGLQYFTLSEVKPYVTDAEPPQHSQVGCLELGWIDIHVATLRPISIYSLKIGSIFL